MPSVTPTTIPPGRRPLEPQRALLTPSASPSVPPPDRPAKRLRLRSTPSSVATSNESTTSTDVNSARRASTLRVLNVWAQLAERYNKRLDEDDIVDLYSGAIIKDRGVVKNASRDYPIGHFGQPDNDQDYVDADQDQEDSEQDEDDNELLPPSEAATDDDTPISKKELLRGVPPLSATTDAEDLREFLEAEKKRRELVGDEDDEEDLPPEQLSAIREALEEHAQAVENANTNQAHDAMSTEHAQQPEVGTTPRRPSTRILPSDDDSEDELAVWTHDESTAVYPLARDESERDANDVVQEVIELTETDSDEEFEAILTRPPRTSLAPSTPVPHLKEVPQPLRSPQDGGCRRSESRTRFRPKTKSKTEATSKFKTRSRSPVVSRKPQVNPAPKKKPPLSEAMNAVASNDGESGEGEAGRVSPAHKGKGKETSTPVDEKRRETTLKSPGAASRGRKRKRITSSTISNPLEPRHRLPSPSSSSSNLCATESKNNLRNHEKRKKPVSQGPATLPQPDGPESAPNEDPLTPAWFACGVPGPSHSSSSVPITQRSSSSVPDHRPWERESVQPISHSHHSDKALFADPTIAINQRHPRSSSIFSSPIQGTSGWSSVGSHLPPPVDPVQTQQAHYLLAQAMQQLSYLISAMPPYTAYSPNLGQLWHHPPHAANSTPIHHPSHLHGTGPYHTPSSSISSGLPPSSPDRSLVSPIEERRPRRGQSKPRGRRVSFEIDGGEAAGNQGHNIRPEPHHGGQKKGKQTLEPRRESGKEKITEESEDRGNSVRGRTPGPPGRKKVDVSRGRSLSRR